MNKLNKFLGYIYYALALAWVVCGGYYYFFLLEQYHKNIITAVYGLLIAVLIFYIGYLHKKVNALTTFPIASLINIALAAMIVYIYFTSPENGGLLTFMLLVINAITTLITLIIGTFLARKDWPKASIISICLVTSIVIWTYVFTSF